MNNIFNNNIQEKIESNKTQNDFYKGVRQIIFGGAHSFMLNYSGEIFALGHNVNGQLGLGDNENRYTPIPFSSCSFGDKDKVNNNEIQQITCGLTHSLILKKSSELFVFGHNSNGQLGLGDNEDRYTPTLLMKDENIKQVWGVHKHSFILKKTGELYAFGDNEYGQLGLGDKENIYAPTLVMRDENIKQIYCGAYYTFILKKSGELFAFGYNEDGQLGLGDNNNRNVPTLVTKDENIKQIVCGMYHTLILKKSGENLDKAFVLSSLNRPLAGHGELFAFGYNYYGQLGLGDNMNRNIPTHVMRTENATSIHVQTCSFGDENIKQIYCGENHTFILKKSGELFTFGNNLYGQLGLEDSEDRNIPTLVVIDKNIKQIYCGEEHTYILKESGELYACGYKHIGQLGLDYCINKYKLTLVTKFENIISMSETIIEKIKWKLEIYPILSKTKKEEINNFLLICHYYHKNHKIRMVRNMINMIINLLF